MNIIKINPRGACHGVVTAIQMLTDLAYDETVPRPIYILGMIVHNKHYTQAFDELGIITLASPNKSRLELLDEIDSGTVVMTAHGVSPKVIQKAKDKGLYVVDATCIDVHRTHDLIKEKIAEGYEFIYIGKKGHPEPEGAVDIDNHRVHLIEDENDLNLLEIQSDKIMITNQTTLSLWDVAKLANHIQEKFPQAIFQKEICNATQIRQEAVANIEGADLVIVVGDVNSNNTKKLASVSEEIAHIPSIRIADLSELDINDLLDSKIQTVAVTSGASTPTLITKQVVQFIENLDKENELTWDKSPYLPKKSILPRVVNLKK